MEEQNVQSAEQGGNGQGTGEQQGHQNQGAGKQESDFVPRAEYIKAKEATAEILKKRDEARAEAAKLKARLDELEKKAAENAVDPEEIKKRYEDIISGITSERDKLKQTIRDKDVYGKIRSVATTMNAQDPEVVLRIIQPDLVYDENGTVGINDGTGNPDINKETGKRLTLEEYVSSVLEKNKFLVKPTGNTGGGSGSSTGNSQIGSLTQAQIKGMTLEEYQKNRATILNSIGR